MRVPLRWVLGVGFAVELVRAILCQVKDWIWIHRTLDWRQIHIFLKNMPAGIKGSRYRVDKKGRGLPTDTGKD